MARYRASNVDYVQRRLHGFHGWKLCYREVTMKTLVEEEETLLAETVGPDPLLMKKRGIPVQGPRDIKAYKKKIRDDVYMDHAINRIAMELMHFLVR